MAGSDSPTFFHGQPWSNWIEKIGRDKPLSDDEPEAEPASSVTRLSADDIDLYGFCPETDTFYGVVCEICNAIVKPQALHQHMESRHSSGAVNLPPPAPIPASKAPLKTPYCKITKLSKKTSSSSLNNSTSGSATSGDSSSLTTNSKLNHTSVKRTAEQANLQSLLPSHAPRSPHDALNQLANSSGVPSSPVKSPGTNGNPTTTTPTTAASSGPPRRKRLKGDRGLVKDREYDADRHCGVWNDETGKPCTRSLTCKAHTVSLRRTVPGRSKSFDKLLAEHRASKDLPNRTSKVTVTGTVTVSTPSVGLNPTGNIVNDNEAPGSPPVLSLPDTYPLPKTKLEEDFVKEEMRLESSLAATSGKTTSSNLTKSMMAPISVLLPSLSPIRTNDVVGQVATLIPATTMSSSTAVTTPLPIHGQLPATVLEGETLSDIDNNDSMTLYSPVSLFKDTKTSQIVMQLPRTNSHLQSSTVARNYQTHSSSMPSIIYDEQIDSPKNQLVNGKRLNNHTVLLSPIGRTKRIKHEFNNDYTNSIQIDTTTNSSSTTTTTTSTTNYPHYGDISWSNCHPEPLAVNRWLRITSTRKQYNFNIH